MLIAKIYDHTIVPGTNIEVPGVDDFEFKVLNIGQNSFEVEWLTGDEKGTIGHVPYSIFGSGVVEVSDITDDVEPNKAFKFRKLMHGD